jgi:hypothetical protein
VASGGVLVLAPGSAVGDDKTSSYPTAAAQRWAVIGGRLVAPLGFLRDENELSPLISLVPPRGLEPRTPRSTNLWSCTFLANRITGEM